MVSWQRHLYRHFIITSVNTTYKNLVGERSWGKTSDKDAKIIALTTSLNKQKNKRSELATKMNSSGGTSAKKVKENKLPAKPKNNNGDLPSWRVTFKGKKITGEDGGSYEWCKEHAKAGKFDGIYMPAPHDHAAWKKRKEDYFKRREDRKGSNNKPTSSSAPSSKGPALSKMAISKNLQAALVSKLGISDKDAESMATDILGKD